MRYCIVCLLLVIVSFGQVNAQENRNGFRLDTIYKSGAKRQVVRAPVKKSVPLKSSVSRKVGKWTLSGSCGMSFGDYTSIDVSPQIGYRWNEFFSAGGGGSYNYHHSSNRYDMNYLGINVFGRVNPVRYIALQIQPELKEVGENRMRRRLTSVMSLRCSWGEVELFPPEQALFP